MFIDPSDLPGNLEVVEEIERASLRLVTQALADFRQAANDIFVHETDLPADKAEDITREALDSMGVPKIPARLFGKMDYKRARYIFHPNYAVRQAMFIDSKAEKEERTATLQKSQTSMRIRHVRAGDLVDEQGTLLTVAPSAQGNLLTTTIFVKFFYEEPGGTEGPDVLKAIQIACVPNGMLQEQYNPTPQDTIWMAGRNAPTLDEDFRVRLSFDLLRQKAAWRVQNIQIDPEEPFAWAE